MRLEHRPARESHRRRNLHRAAYTLQAAVRVLFHGAVPAVQAAECAEVADCPKRGVRGVEGDFDGVVEGD